MARSTQQQLDDCDARIAAIENGAQAYTMRTRGATYALYKDLCTRRDRLEEKLAIESNNGGYMASVGQIDRPT